MLTSSQLYQLDQSIGSDVVSGMVSNQGNLLPLSALIAGNSMCQYWGAGICYTPSTNTIIIRQAGAALNGYNLSGMNVVVDANNVTISNCTFDDKVGWLTVVQSAGYSGMVVQNCTFNGGDNVELANFVSSITGYVTIANNLFLNTPAHSIGLTDGVVENNQFIGGGYQTGAHVDAINIYNTTGSVLVTGNYIDWTNNANAVINTNNAIRITNEGGATANVTVTNNIMLGGAYTVAVVNVNSDPTATFSNVVISGNYVGDYQYGGYYPGAPAGVTIGPNTDVGFDNPALATAAWAAYQTSGIVTDSLVMATTGQNAISAATTGTSTLYGNGVAGVHLWGGSSETIFVGGAGLDYMWGGSGKNVYSFLAVADSTPQSFDDICNFNVATDVIDLHSLNAEPGSATPVSFNFIGGAPFSTAGGEICVVQDVVDNETLVEADLVGDSSADLEVAICGMVNLTAANFALTTAQYESDTAAYTTIASFLTSQWTLDQVSGGYSIVDSAANIQANLNGLEADAAKIDQVTPTTGVVSVNAATLNADQTILNAIVGGYAVVDSAANIQANLAGLETDAANIVSVTLNAGALSVNAATFNADQAVLNEIANGFAVVDSAVNIQANLASLEADASKINSVTETGGVISVNIANFTADQSLLTKLSGSYSIVDTGANVQTQMCALEKAAGSITTVAMSDSTAASPDVLTLTQANAKADAAILSKIVEPYILDATNGGTSTVSGIGSGLTLDINAGNSIVTGGAAGDTFYFSSNFGTAQITDFATYANGATPDAIALSTADFANWSTLMSDGHSSGGNANTTFISADGASLTVQGISLSAFQHAGAALQAEFKFHA